MVLVFPMSRPVSQTAMVCPAPDRPSALQALETFILLVLCATSLQSFFGVYGSIHSTSPQPASSSIADAVTAARTSPRSAMGWANSTEQPGNAATACPIRSASPGLNTTTFTSRVPARPRARTSRTGRDRLYSGRYSPTQYTPSIAPIAAIVSGAASTR